MRLRSALGAAAVIVVCLLAAMVGGHAPGAAASGPNRAVVVADSGTGVLVRGIEFEADSISGVEALQLAGLDPVLQGFDGQGGAVCALQGVGCPSDGSCLTCDPRGYYWAYHRAPAGSSAFTYSRVGAGATRVHDGDVEGWKWGTGSPPPFHSFASVFPAPTTPPTSSGGTGGTGNGGTGDDATPAPGAPGAPGVAAGTPSTGASATGGAGGPASTVPGATTSVAPTATTSTTDGAGEERTTSERTDGSSADEVAFQAAQSSRPADSPGSKGWAASAALFALTLAVIAALVVRSRRRRRPA